MSTSAARNSAADTRTGKLVEVAPRYALRSTIKVMVVDDHPAVRWSLVSLLGDQPELRVAAVAASAQAAVAEVERRAIDVAVIDYHLGGPNGLWVTRTIKELDRPPRAVIFSAFANDHLAANCAVAGADAMLSKGSLGDDLCYAIGAVARGRRLLPRVPLEMADLLHSRLEDELERTVFGMLLAEIPEERITSMLRIDTGQLSDLRTSILSKLQALPGERLFSVAGPPPVASEHLVSP